MSTEDRFWDDLRRALPKGHWVRVENPTDPGTPDVSFCLDVRNLIDPVEGWMELKYCDRLPLSLSCNHPLLPSQKLWASKRLRYGGRVLIAVGIAKAVYFVHGTHYTTINDWLIDDYEEWALSFSLNRRNPQMVQRAFLEAIERY